MPTAAATQTQNLEPRRPVGADAVDDGAERDDRRDRVGNRREVRVRREEERERGHTRGRNEIPREN